MSAWGAHIARCYRHKPSEIGEKEKKNIRTANQLITNVNYMTNLAPQLFNMIQLWY
jgi:hypothetical protein